MERNPSARIVFTNRVVTTTSGIAIGGIKPRVIAYVKTGCRKHRHDWEHWTAKLGLDALPVQDLGDGFVTVFDVAGTPQALETVLARACVKQWHFALDSRVAFQGVGTLPKA